MNLMTLIDIAAGGISAQGIRLIVISMNLANASSVRAAKDMAPRALDIGR